MSNGASNCDGRKGIMVVWVMMQVVVVIVDTMVVQIIVKVVVVVVKIQNKSYLSINSK